jgi:hypothetical protein
VRLRAGEIDGFKNKDITAKRLAAEERALAGESTRKTGGTAVEYGAKYVETCRP